jgi:hypothetical protein
MITKPRRARVIITLSRLQSARKPTPRRGLLRTALNKINLRDQRRRLLEDGAWNELPNKFQIRRAGNSWKFLVSQHNSREAIARIKSEIGSDHVRSNLSHSKKTSARASTDVVNPAVISPWS